MNKYIAYNLGQVAGLRFFRPPFNYGSSEGKDLRLIANIIEGGEGAVRFDNCFDCIAANNTIVRPFAFVLRFGESNSYDTMTPKRMLPLRHLRFFNNVVFWNDSVMGQEFNFSSTVDVAEKPTYWSRYNLWHDESLMDSMPAYNGVQPYSLEEKMGNPNFVDFVNYKITSGSPAATNLGLSLTEVKSDMKSDHPTVVSCPSGCAVFSPEYELDEYGSCYLSSPSRGAHQALP